MNLKLLESADIWFLTPKQLYVSMYNSVLGKEHDQVRRVLKYLSEAGSGLFLSRLLDASNDALALRGSPLGHRGVRLMLQPAFINSVDIMLERSSCEPLKRLALEVSRDDDSFNKLRTLAGRCRLYSRQSLFLEGIEQFLNARRIDCYFTPYLEFVEKARAIPELEYAVGGSISTAANAMKRQEASGQLESLKHLVSANYKWRTKVERISGAALPVRKSALVP